MKWFTWLTFQSILLKKQSNFTMQYEVCNIILQFRKNYYIKVNSKCVAIVSNVNNNEQEPTDEEEEITKTLPKYHLKVFS